MDKKCSLCPHIGPADTDFFQRKKGNSSYASPYCKECERKKAREAKKARYRDPEKGPKVKARAKERTSAPEYREKLNQSLKIRYAEDSEYRQSVLDRMKTRREDPIEREKIRAQATASYQRNKRGIMDRQAEKVRSDPKLKIRGYMRSRVSEALAAVGKSKDRIPSLHYLPYSWDDLYRHLESQFEDWMTFSNYGAYDPTRRTWQVDHVVPQAFFPYDSMDSELFRMCWDLRNLRPYEASSNFAEGNRPDLIGPVRDIRQIFQEVRDGLSSAFSSKETLSSVLDRLSKVQPVTNDCPAGHAGLSYLDSLFSKRFRSRTARFPSLVESLEDDWALFRTVCHCVKRGERVTPASVIANLRFVVRTPGHFFPAAAASIWKAYAPVGSSVFDPFLGWGGRMLGASTAGVSRFVGCDLQPEVIDSCRRLRDELSSMSATIFDIHEGDVLPFLRSSDEKFGLIFTSPPFMDTEDYGVESDSMRGSWVDDFVFPLTEQFRLHLAPGGRVALHLKDLKGAPTFTAYHSAMKASGFRQVMKHKYGRTWTQAVYVYEVA